MAWLPARPLGSDAISASDELIRDNWAALETNIEVEHEDLGAANAGEHLSGSARAYYGDYDDIANLPDLVAGAHVGYSSGRLAFNNSANMPGQMWEFDGALWQPHSSPRHDIVVDDTMAGNVNPDGAWTDWDNAMDTTLYMADNGDWQYEIGYNGTFYVSNGVAGACNLQWRLYDGAASIASGALGIIPASESTYFHLHAQTYYTPAADGNVTVKLQLKSNQAIAVNRTFGLDVKAPHTQYIKEIPA